MTLNILPQKYMNLVIIIPNAIDALKNPCLLQISEKGQTSYQKKIPVLEKCGPTRIDSELNILIFQ